jgi:hypothetical protein
MSQYLLNRKLGWSQRQAGLMEKRNCLPLVGIDPRIIQPIKQFLYLFVSVLKIERIGPYRSNVLFKKRGSTLFGT